MHIRHEWSERFVNLLAEHIIEIDYKRAQDACIVSRSIQESHFRYEYKRKIQILNNFEWRLLVLIYDNDVWNEYFLEVIHRPNIE